MKNKKKLIIPVTLLSLFIVLTISLALINVSIVGETGKEIGLAFINEVSIKLSYNKYLDKFSDIFLGLSILLIFVCIVIGLIQLIKRKNVLKVDKEILTFGMFLICLMFLWILFDKAIVINYRPILIKGKLEPSYPSTHVMLVSFTLLSFVSLMSKYIYNKKVINICYIIGIVFVIITCLFRVLSGMHWITDCVGGLLLGLFLYFGYTCAINFRKDKENI